MESRRYTVAVSIGFPLLALLGCSALLMGAAPPDGQRPVLVEAEQRHVVVRDLVPRLLDTAHANQAGKPMSLESGAQMGYLHERIEALIREADDAGSDIYDANSQYVFQSKLEELRQLLAVIESPETRRPGSFLGAFASLYGQAREALQKAHTPPVKLSATTFSAMTRMEYEALKAAGKAPALPSGVEDRLPVAANAPKVGEKRAYSVWDVPTPARLRNATQAGGGVAAGPPARVNSGWIEQQYVTDPAMPAPLTTANAEAVPTVATDNSNALYVVMLWQRSSDAILGGFFDGFIVFRSADYGETWQWSAYLYNTNTPIRSISWPHMAIDPGLNRVFVAYESEDWDTTPSYVNEGIYLLYYDVYVAGGPYKVSVAASLTTDDVYPIVASEFGFSPNYVGIVYQTNSAVTGSDIRYQRSTDSGVTWSAAATVVGTADSEGLPWISAGATGAGGSRMTISYQAAYDPFSNDLSYLGDDMYAVTAINGDPTAFSTNPKTVVLNCSAFDYSDHHDSSVAHSHGSGDVAVVAEVNRSFYDDIEGSTTDWTSDGSWSVDTLNYPKSWFTDDVTYIRDSRLQTPAQTLTARSKLYFVMRGNMETGYDGGVIEISTNGGATWTDLGSRITWNAYNYTLSSCCGNPLSGRGAWSGSLNAGWYSVIADLSVYAGASARIRFRMGTDSCCAATEPNGWWIDDVYITNVDPGHNVSFGYSVDDGTTWNANWWFNNPSIQRYPSVAPDGMGSTSVNAAWSNFHLARYSSPASPSLGTVQYLRADANVSFTTWYQITSSIDASDDSLVQAQSMCLSICTYRVGLPALAWMRNSGSFDVYYTTLGDNYQFDTKYSGGHIPLTVDVDGLTLATVDYEAWPSAVTHGVDAPLSGDIGVYHYGFIDWTWASGTQAVPSLSVTSAYSPPPPDVVYDANYGRCTVQQPSVGNTVRGTKVSGFPNFVWTDPGGQRDGFRIYRATDPSLQSNFGVIGTTGGTSYWDSSASGSPYFYKVISFCGTNPSDTHEGPWGVLAADFSSNAPVCGNSPYLVTFTNLTSGGVPPYSYIWNFGDGSPNSTQTNPSHTYAASGSYLVTLTATDSDAPSPKVSVRSHSVGVGPVVSASFTYGKIGLTAYFDGIPSGGLGLYSYRWGFGDGSPMDITEDPVHTYGSGGTYTVSFTVWDVTTGCSDSISQPVTVP